jgi:hypothetical protein
MTLRRLLGLNAPKQHPTRPLPVLPAEPFNITDPCTFPCAFLSTTETDLRADR